MNLSGLNHVTLRCRPSDLPALSRFYGEVLGMRAGWRPPFPFDGLWMYPARGEVAAIHIAATLRDDAPLPTPCTPGGMGFDHVSLTCTGLADGKARLEAAGVPYQQLPVPGADIMQLFLTDPVGVKIELTYVGER